MHDLDDELNLGKDGAAMYGREKQKQQIAEFLGDFEMDGKTSLVAIKGPSGVGKSTLVKYIFSQVWHYSFSF
jgi:Cdc6-like AAA superfamily ATPase